MTETGIEIEPQGCGREQCKDGWIPCTNHQPEVPEADGFQWCETCEGTGWETCWECG